MITRKGWRREVRKNKHLKLDEKDPHIYHEYDVTYASTRNSFGGLRIHVQSWPRRRTFTKADYSVTTSGMPIRIYNRKFSTLPQAESYVRKIMKWYDAGRIKYKLIKND